MLVYSLIMIAIGAFLFRVFLYPHTISEEIFELDEIESIDEENIRFFTKGDMIIRNVENRWIIRGVNYNHVRLIKFRSCTLLYNHTNYDVVLISIPEEEYDKDMI